MKEDQSFPPLHGEQQSVGKLSLPRRLAPVCFPCCLVLLGGARSTTPVLGIQVQAEIHLRLLEERHVEEYVALIERNRAYLREWDLSDAYLRVIFWQAHFVERPMWATVQQDATSVSHKRLGSRPHQPSYSHHSPSIGTPALVAPPTRRQGQGHRWRACNPSRGFATSSSECATLLVDLS